MNKKREAHPDRCENTADGGKNTLSWGNTGDFLRVIQGLDAHIQRRDSTLSSLRSLEPGVHSWNSRWPRVSREGCEGGLEP